MVSGEVDEPGFSFALTAEDRADDVVLACATRPAESCTIDLEPNGVTEQEFLSGDNSTTYLAAVADVRHLAADIAAVRFDLPPGEAMSFTAGQFVNLEVPGSGAVRTFSLANAPAEADRVELIVKLHPDGAFSTFLRDEALPGTPVRITGPFGELKIRRSHRPVLMIAGGSGLAPLLSMLRQMVDEDFARPVTLFFGARTEADLYLVEEISALGEKLQDFSFIPVLSHSWGADWPGETGLVTEAIARWRTRLEHDVYLCGPPPMIDAAVPQLLAAGVRPRNIYFDAFTPATAPLSTEGN
jgi:propane monooxygenase reductase subunit